MAQDIITSLRKKYQGKKVLVVGLGLLGGGVGITRFFAELGAKVTVTDKKPKKKLLQSINRLSDLPITYNLGRHELKDFLEADVIFKGPSVPWDLSEIIEAQKKNVSIEMELSFFAANFPGKIVGITGTRGKSTITNMIFSLMKQSGFSVYLGGSLPGISTINFLKTLTKDDWVVMEISSWALSGFHRKKISPYIAVFTNIYPDHLNYYKNMDEYLYDKKAIFMYQKKGDYSVVNENLKGIIFGSEKTNSRRAALKANLDSGLIPSSPTRSFARMTTFSYRDFPSKLIYLKGKHNLENAATALQVAKILKIDEKKAIKIISNFQGLPYRQEIVGKKGNIIFVNDTTSTTPIATLKAIETYKDKKIILILGGNSKNLPFDQLINRLNKVYKIILLGGSFTDQILDTLRVSVPEKLSKKIYRNLEEAVKEAYRIASKLHRQGVNDTKAKLHPEGESEVCILFSPAATSFAMFDNEFHRGDEFNRIVKNLINE